MEDTLAFSPEAAVLLNISADHLDRHGTLEAYKKAKLEVFARQRSETWQSCPPVSGSSVCRAGPRVSFGAEPRAQLRERATECSIGKGGR